MIGQSIVNKVHEHIVNYLTVNKARFVKAQVGFKNGTIDIDYVQSVVKLSVNNYIYRSMAHEIDIYSVNDIVSTIIKEADRIMEKSIDIDND